MDANQRMNFTTPEYINLEIRRRASVLAQSDLATTGAEDPYVVASRQVLQELLATFAEQNKNL